MKTLGPEATFARGFSITLDAQGKPVTDASKVEKGDQLVSQLAKGKLISDVNDIHS